MKSPVRRLTCGVVSLLSFGSVAVAQKAPSGPACTSSAWTGTVSYSRNQSLSESKTIKRVSGRGEDSRDFQLNYSYKAVVAVTESPDGDGSSLGKATVTHSMTSTDRSTAKETNSCDQGKTWQEMTGNFMTEQKTTGDGKDDASVSIGINDDGTYTVSVGAPRIKGRTSGSQKSSFSGQCTKKEGKSLNFPESETSIEGGSLSSNGRDRVDDPVNPRRLSGSYSQTMMGVTESITWNLEKCGAPLRVTDLTFEDMKFPTWDAWQEISEQRATVDGNWVRIKATVFNGSAERRSGVVYLKETYKGDKWDGARPDVPLKNQSLFVDLEAGEAKDVEMLWDSSGYAWYDDGRPRYVQRVKAELWEKNKLVDDMTRNLKVAPKPLVLMHGPWTTWQTFSAWQNILTMTHSYDWKAYAVGEKADKTQFTADPSAGAAAPIARIANGLKGYVRYAQEDRNAWHVDMVGHGGGGVVTRYYVSRLMPENYPDGRPQVSHLLLLGTPNLGTPCASSMANVAEWNDRDASFLRQMNEEAMTAFNQQFADTRGVKLSALAGTGYPIACWSLGDGDGIVPVKSAHWTIADRATSDSDHDELTSTKDFTQFVKPRLVAGPRGDHGPAVPGK